jgi:hypothetical protein
MNGKPDEAVNDDEDDSPKNQINNFSRLNSSSNIAYNS